MSEGGGRGPVLAASVVVASVLLLVVLGILGLVVLLDPVP
jgi:hypothetical protein